MTSGWPAGWPAAAAGEDCHLCAEGRPDNPERGPRFFAGHHSDAYLSRRGVQRGWGVVIWRGSHAVELGDLTQQEMNGYMSEVAAVANAMRRHFRAIKMNVSFLGNGSPHLHAIIASRFEEGDVAPGRPIPFERGVLFDTEQLERDRRPLTELLDTGSDQGRALATDTG